MAAAYAEAPIGALPEHHLEKATELPKDLAAKMVALNQDQENLPSEITAGGGHITCEREEEGQPHRCQNERERARKRLQYLLEVYIDDFIAAAQAKSPEELKHISRAILHAIHDVFPENVHSPGDQPVSIRKMDKGEAQWNVLKEVLGWICDGKEKTI